MSTHRATKRNRDKSGHFKRTPNRPPRPGPKPHPDAQPLLDRDGNMTGWQWAVEATMAPPKPAPLPKCARPTCRKRRSTPRGRYCGRDCYKADRPRSDKARRVEAKAKASAKAAEVTV